MGQERPAVEPWQKRLTDLFASGGRVRVMSQLEQRRAARRHADSLYLAALLVDGFTLEIVNGRRIRASRDGNVQWVVFSDGDYAAAVFWQAQQQLQHLRDLD